MVTPGGLGGGGPDVAVPGTLMILPVVMALEASGTLICCDGARLTVCNAAPGVLTAAEPAGSTVILEVLTGMTPLPILMVVVGGALLILC